MLLEGFTLTIIGMAIVFVFLTLMVIAMNLLAGVLRRFFPKSMEEPVVVHAATDTEIAIAVAAAKAYTKA